MFEDVVLIGMLARRTAEAKITEGVDQVAGLQGGERPPLMNGVLRAHSQVWVEALIMQTVVRRDI
jgi:hypothetical protein